MNGRRYGILQFNAEGSVGLVNSKMLGNQVILGERQCVTLRRIVDEDPIQAMHDVVRWRIVGTPGSYAVVLLDQTGWHTMGKLLVPSNITLMPLSAKSAELNPAEDIWKFMRDN